MPKFKIVIEYDGASKQMQIAHPDDAVLTFGILERAKMLVASKLDKAAPNSGIVGVRGTLPIPPAGGIGRV